MVAWSFPRLSFAVLLLAVAIPILLAQRDGASGRIRQWVARYRNAVTAIALGAAIVEATHYLVVAHPVIGGLDFFYYVCTARDNLYEVAGASLSRYGYFPGGYRFWEAVLGLFGEQLATLQYAVAGVLAANAALVGAIVVRAANRVPAGMLAGLLYVALASRFEGLEGTTEPIATLFALLGVLAWGGRPLRGPAGWRRAVLLGVGLGLAVWAKQQGGIVAIGALALLVTNALVRRDERSAWVQMAAVPLVAALVLLGAVLLEGHGLIPLRIGLGAVGQYEVVGSFGGNVRALIGRAGVAGWLALIALVLWSATAAIPRLRHIHAEPWVAIVSFSLIASLATLAQFSKRPYLHYALLAAPFLSIAITLVCVRIWQAAAVRKPQAASLVALALAGVLAMPMVGSMGSQGFFQIWPLTWNPRVAHETPWHLLPDVAPDVRSIGALVTPGEDLLVVPPRRNVLHFLLGTRSISSPMQYGWGPQDVSPALMSPSLSAVIVLDRRTLDETDIQTCASTFCDRTVAALAENGFVKTAELKTMTLWRRVR